MMNLDPCRRLSKSPPAGSRCRYGLHHADHRQPVSLVPRLKPSLVRWAISHGGDAAQRIIHADAINERSVIKLAAEPLPALWFGPRASETAPELRTPAWLLKWAVLGGPSDVEAMAHSRPLADCRHERVCSFVIDILGMSGAAPPHTRTGPDSTGSEGFASTGGANATDSVCGPERQESRSLDVVGASL